jgi:hypothetical protein
MTEIPFFVRPLEVAFFGPPDAQAAGDTHYARSLFPPPPRAFQGFVRSRLLAAAEPPLDLSDPSRAARQERAALVGDSDRLPKGWQIEGPVPAAWCRDRECLVPWLPAPRFLRRQASARWRDRPPLRSRFVALDREDRAQGGVNGTGSKAAEQKHTIGTRGLADSGPLEEWVDSQNLHWALTGKGDWSPAGRAELPPMVRRQLRVGLAVDPASRRAQDRMLYAVDQLHFDGKGGFVGTLRADLSSGLSPEALTAGTAPFGRGNRLAALEQLPDVDPAWTDLLDGKHLPREPPESARFWMVSITPWRCEAGAARNASPEHPALSPKLHGDAGADSIEFLGALLGKPLTLGGFSMAEGRARANQIYVPAGSAWLFRVPGVSPARRGEILSALNRSHCLGPREEARMGFGRVLVGTESDG